MVDFNADRVRQRMEEEHRQRQAGQIPGQEAPRPGIVPGQGAQREGRGLLDRVSGESNFTAMFPGYNNEAGYNDRVASAQARGQQQELGNAIQDRAIGRGGPSPAELQMQRGMNQAQQRIAQQAASARGMSRAGANMAAIRGASDVYANTNEQAGIMRAQEQIAAQQLAGQNVRDMRQQDLLSRGYSIEEAKAILDAQLRVQEINAGLASGDAQRGQGPAMMGMAAAGGALAALSDRNAKEVMYSDFTMKEDPGLRPSPARTDMLAAPPPDPAVRAAGGFQPMLTVTPTPDVDKAAEEQRQSLGEQAMASAAGAGGGSDLAASAKSGFDIGSALGGVLGGLSDIRAKELMPSDFTGKQMMKAHPSSGSTFDISGPRVRRMANYEFKQGRREYEERMDRARAFKTLRDVRDPGIRASDDEDVRTAMSSDFRSKEPTMGELDQVGEEAMLPFREMDAQDSREALAPVNPVVYRYKPEDSARMAGEQANLADLRARYAGMGGAAPEEEQAIAQGTFEDKRTPRLGIIAQDLQKSPDFRQSVVSTPAGLAVQRDRALSTALGSLAGIDKRLRDLEDLGDSKAAEIRGEPVHAERARRRFKEKGGTNQMPMGEKRALMRRYMTEATAR